MNCVCCASILAVPGPHSDGPGLAAYLWPLAKALAGTSSQGGRRDGGQTTLLAGRRAANSKQSSRRTAARYMQHRPCLICALKKPAGKQASRLAGQLSSQPASPVRDQASVSQIGDTSDVLVWTQSLESAGRHRETCPFRSMLLRPCPPCVRPLAIHKVWCRPRGQLR